MAALLLGLRNSALSLLWGGAAAPLRDAVDSQRLVRIIRRFPDWPVGHKILAKDALARDDVATAYAAALCYRQLSKDSTTALADASLLIGRCFLRRGEGARALDALEKAHQLAPNSYEISEDLAAAMMLVGKYDEAKAVMSGIPSPVQTPQAKAALKFLKNKRG